MKRGLVCVSARHRCPDGEEHHWPVTVAYRYTPECRTDRHGDPGWPEELEVDELPDTCPRCARPLPSSELARLSEDVGSEIANELHR